MFQLLICFPNACNSQYGAKPKRGPKIQSRSTKYLSICCFLGYTTAGDWNKKWDWDQVLGTACRCPRWQQMLTPASVFMISCMCVYVHKRHLAFVCVLNFYMNANIFYVSKMFHCFMYLKQRENIFQPLVHSPNAYSRQGWTTLKPGSWNSQVGQ